MIQEINYFAYTLLTRVASLWFVFKGGVVCSIFSALIGVYQIRVLYLSFVITKST